MVEPMLGATISPTMISRLDAARTSSPASARSPATAGCCPATTPADVEPRSREALGEDSYDLEWVEAVGGTRSPLATPLWDAIEAFVEPRTTRAPASSRSCSPGFTDSHFLREAFGTVAYGFFPMRTMDPEVAAKLIHSADERIAVEDLELGVRFLRARRAATLGR